MSKTIACLIGVGVIAIFGIMSFIWPDRAVQLPAILTALGGLIGAYFVNQTINNGVKGRFWNQEMHNAECARRDAERNNKGEN